MTDPTDPRVPYSPRMHLFAKGGSALVWPFIDRGPRQAVVELVLDNNALTNAQWLAEVKAQFDGYAISINPWLALVEQWLSNEQFRSSPENRIKGFLEKFEMNGIHFDPDYPKMWAERLRRNDPQLRYYFGILFAYVAIMKKLVDWRRGTPEPFALLVELSRANVPRLSACLLLSCVALFLKEKQSLKLAGDSTTAMSYLSSFFAYQKDKHEPDHITRQYLRNRAGDLTVWYALPMLYEKGVSWAGDPVIVTRDKALYRLIFRLVPPVLGADGGSAIQFTPAYNEIPDDWQALHEYVGKLSFGFSPPVDDNDKLVRLRNLFDFAKRCATDVEQTELDAAWSEWIAPGLGKELTI
jgi:hypothetical protein